VSQSSAQEIQARIANRTARVGIVGLGYVGLPLAVVRATDDFAVVADLDPSGVESVDAPAAA